MLHTPINNVYNMPNKNANTYLSSVLTRCLYNYITSIKTERHYTTKIKITWFRFSHECSIFTLPSGAVAKYCDEYVCVTVCLSARISPKPHARSNFMRVEYGRGSVLLQQGDEILRGRGHFGGFFSNDSALYSIAFGTHTNTAEPIKMPFGLMTRLGPRNGVLRGGDDLQGKGANFGKTFARQA